MTEENQTVGSSPVGESAAERKLAEKVAAVTASGVHAAPVEPTASTPQSHDVSAATVARMLGLATATEVRLVEGKIDLLSSKISTLQIRAEKMLTILNGMPSGSDLERIDVQLGSIKSLLKDLSSIK